MEAEALIAGRVLQYAGASVTFGTPLFFLYGTPGSMKPDRWPWQRNLLLVAAVCALVGACLWLLAEAASMRGDSADAISPGALWMVASETRFGVACSVRIALLLLAVGACLVVDRPKWLWRLQAGLGGAITMSFAWTGHGATAIAKSAGIHLAADLLHLLAAGIWVGALVPLAVLGFRASQSKTGKSGQELLVALKEFSRLGVWVVAVLVFTGIVNSIFLVDLVHWQQTLNSLYGRVLLVKLALFGGMLGFAALHRYKTTPRLESAMQGSTLPAAPVTAAWPSLLTEALLAALVLGAVSVLGTLAPPEVVLGD